MFDELIVNKEGILALGEAVGRLVYANPFLPERIEWERKALGSEFEEGEANWNLSLNATRRAPNVRKLQNRVERALEIIARGGIKTNVREQEIFEGLILFHLFHRFTEPMDALIRSELGGEAAGLNAASLFREFRQAAIRLFGIGSGEASVAEDPAHIFASLFQIRRAFFLVASSLVGRSDAMVRLRASIWQSIFTWNMRRYRRALYTRMGDVATLITGPTGTGKELVARAIGLSQYVPFDASKGKFEGSFADGFQPLNLSALSPTLIESELFGHEKGAFTGASQDRAGWLEACPGYGAVFLDEIGELDPAIQVKLLRVLQTRTFQRIGDVKARSFSGRILAATHRNLEHAVRAGSFREDFYYRICSDRLETPSLAEQLHDPGELEHLVRFLAVRIAGESEAGELTDEVCGWVARNIGADYQWPGNFRELEQCIRSIMIRGRYNPLPVGRGSAGDPGAEAFLEGFLSADALLSLYCKRVYARCGSYEAAGRQLGMDRRTVRRHVEAVPPSVQAGAPQPGQGAVPLNSSRAS